jgi:predicted XRE-type DNA-binding protein
MGVLIKPTLNFVGKVVRRKGEKWTSHALNKRQKTIDQNVVTANRTAAQKFAKSIGLNPIESNELEIRLLLTEKIIEFVKEKNLTQGNLALSAQTSRTRINALINKHVDKFTINALVDILAVLGIKVKIEVIDP